MLMEMVIDGVDLPEDGDHADPAGVLLARIAHGDQSAFAEFYDMLSPRVFGLILRILVDRSQSEEVLQEVFLEVWQSAASFDASRGSVRSWLFTLGHRRAVDRVRSSDAARARDVTAGMKELATPSADVAEQVQLSIEGKRAVEAMSAIPEAQRHTLVLAYFGGYTQSEIAVLLGVPLGTVKTRIRDGLGRLRTALEDR